MRTLGRYLAAFGRFWWDFLVGDTPELFLGVLVVVAVALVLRHDRAASVAAVPLLAVALLALSTYRGRRRA
jgi:hypothetical protein